MTVNLPYLLFAILLLWFPRQWLRVGSVGKRRRSGGAKEEKEPWRERESGNLRVRFGNEFSKFRNYLDLLRGAAGSLALVGGMGISASLAVPPDAPTSQVNTVIGLCFAIMLVGLMVQTVRPERGKITFYPAIFFITGLTVGPCGPWGALFAFLLIWVFNIMIPNPRYFLATYAAAVTAFGLIFGRQSSLSALSAGLLVFAPVLVSLLAARPLVIPSRKGTHETK